MRPVSILIIGFIAVLAGCGSVTFKRGAGPDSMAADERSCRAAAADEAGFAGCMRERGWFVAMTGEDAVTTSAADRWLETQQGDQDHVGAATAPAGAVPQAPAAKTMHSGSSAPATVSTASPTQPPAPVVTGAASKPDSAAPAEASFDPLAESSVASWWKLGGSAAALDGAIAACVTELGVAHRPDPAAKRVTAGMRACLRAGGWFAVGN